eukprot:gb/GECG01004905.1/.p1 GENE.gb/GECG01004905.1/~~gb/GECG01004905.1/.p1  ORF type:complete len:466 (+),score=72.80 gb/GECG01004905.1/:1-1398(+)
MSTGKPDSRGGRRGGLLQDAIRYVEGSISEYQLSKAGSELDDKIASMEKELPTLSSEDIGGQQHENETKTLASQFRTVWHRAIMLSEFASNSSQTGQAKKALLQALRTIVPDFSLDNISLQNATTEEPSSDDEKKLPVSLNELCLLLTQLGDFLLQQENDTATAETCYREALRSDPDHFGALGNLANLLHKSRSHMEETEMLYERVAELYPEHTTIITKYGNWCKVMKKDYLRAEKIYKKAIEADPRNPDALGSLAVLLHGVLKQYDAAETFYERAVDACSYHTNNLSNFALFLADIRDNYERAETLYKQALKVAPNHANTLYNYGVLMDSLKKHDDAEQLFTQATQANSSHAYALYNLAVLKEDIRKDLDGAEKLYAKACEAAPRDVSIALDYASFLWKRMTDTKGANEAFAKAFGVLGIDLPQAVDDVPKHLRSLKAQANDEKELALQRYCEFLRGQQVPRFQ